MLAGAALFSCAGETIDVTKPVTGEAATNAEKAYKRGEEERKSSNWIEATKLFEYVKNNFPYSQYSPLSELALADMAFDRDENETAAKAYEEFVKNHPSHPKADYASYRSGLARYNDKASDSWILPPSWEREQAPVKNALDGFNRFLLSYPTSKLVPDARAKIEDCRRRLAAHERYVATFYAKKDAWKGSAQRWMIIAQTYGDLEGGKLRGEAYWMAGDAYRRANDLVDEQLALNRLILQSPGDEHRQAAEQRLADIAQRQAPPGAVGIDPTKVSPPPSAPTPQPKESAPAEKK
jgi:outer membrane protein assembly factor BamD